MRCDVPGLVWRGEAEIGETGRAPRPEYGMRLETYWGGRAICPGVGPLNRSGGRTEGDWGLNPRGPFGAPVNRGGPLRAKLPDPPRKEEECGALKLERIACGGCAFRRGGDERHGLLEIHGRRLCRASTHPGQRFREPRHRGRLRERLHVPHGGTECARLLGVRDAGAWVALLGHTMTTRSVQGFERYSIVRKAGPAILGQAVQSCENSPIE